MLISLLSILVGIGDCEKRYSWVRGIEVLFILILYRKIRDIRVFRSFERGGFSFFEVFGKRS